MNSPVPGPGSELPRRTIRTTVYASVALVLTTAWAMVMYVQQAYLNENPLPNQSFIPNDIIRAPARFLTGTYAFGIHYFGDFQLILVESLQKSPYITGAVEGGSYAPMTFVLLRLWAKIPYKTSFALFMVVTVIGCLLPLLLWLPSRNIWSRIRDAVIIGLLSYPVLVILDRANFEGLTVGFVACGMWAYLKKHYLLCAVLFACAGSIKYYLIIFIVLLLAEWRWRESLVGIGLWTAGIFGGLLDFAYGYGANFRTMVHLAALFVGTKENFHTAIYYNRSLYGMFVVIHYWMSGSPSLAGFFVSHYRVLSVLVVIVWMAAAIQKKWLQLWQRVLLICIVTTIIPNIAGGYTYAILLIPIALFLRAEKPTWHLWVYGLPLAVTMVPKGIGIDTVDGVTITWLNVVDPAILVLIGVALVIECSANSGVFGPESPARRFLGRRGRTSPASDRLAG